MAGSPFAVVPEGLRVFVRLQPRARREGLEGIVTEADGRVALKIAVNAPPEDGKANAALVGLMGRMGRLPKRDIAIVGGATDRRKTLLLRGDAALLQAAIAAHLPAAAKTKP